MIAHMSNGQDHSQFAFALGGHARTTQLSTCNIQEDRPVETLVLLFPLYLCALFRERGSPKTPRFLVLKPRKFGPFFEVTLVHSGCCLNSMLHLWTHSFASNEHNRNRGQSGGHKSRPRTSQAFGPEHTR